MSFQLRPYQTAIIEQARAAMRAGQKSILITAPTGSGKTALTAHMLATAASRGIPSLFVVHRRELIYQAIRTFGAVGVPHFLELVLGRIGLFGDDAQEPAGRGRGARCSMRWRRIACRGRAAVGP